MISRRKFVHDMALAGAAGAMGFGREVLAAEPPPETKRIRLPQTPAVCIAPQYIAEELLRGEGFSDVQYVKVPGAAQIYTTLASGAAGSRAGL